MDPFSDSIVGVAIAGNFGNTYLDVRDSIAKTQVLRWLQVNKWFAHNTLFDGAFIIQAQHSLTQEPYANLSEQLVGDSLTLFRLLASEGWEGQRHNLDVAITDILGWSSNQKRTLDDLLTKHGLGKGDMGKLADMEPEAFARYGAMDAEACWQLHCYLEDVMEAYPTTKPIYQQYINLTQLVVEQRLRGVSINVEALDELERNLDNGMQEKTFAFRSIPEVRSYLSTVEKDAGSEETITSSTKKIYAKKKDAPWNNSEWTPESSDDLATWEKPYGCRWFKEETIQKIKFKVVKESKFNINSKPQLCDLFYNHLGFECKEFTPTGRAKIDKKMLPALGAPGKLLASYNKDLKLHGYVKKLQERSHGGVLHYDLRIHGTVTGRSAGTGGLNVQQLPKESTYLECFTARPGYKLIDTDFTSLENVVLAEHSRDPGMLELYASGKPHDAYLYVACFVFPDSGIAEVYNPTNPTKESVAAAKEQFKKQRSICKVLVLSSNYGASARKVHSTLIQSGVSMSMEEVERIHKRYWQLFAGIKDYGKKLEREWKRRDGFIYNGLGKPCPIMEDKLKDIVNIDCQSTGVGLLHKLIVHINRMRKEQDIPMYPYIVDWHDQTIWEVKEGFEEQARDIYLEAYRLLNEELRPLIPLKGDVGIGTNLWEFKK